MNIEQIRAAADEESFCLNDNSCIRIFVASSIADSSAADLLNAFQDAIHKSGLRAKVFRTGSFGFYDLEPIVVMEVPDLSAVVYHNVTADDVPHLIDDCLTKNVHERDRTLCWYGNKKVDDIPHINELPLFKLQSRIALRNCGWIDPENINHYIVRGHGYAGLSRALQMEKGKLLGVLVESALRGRNETGGSAADTWKFCYESEEEDKSLICNAINADPKALNARLLFESDPHSVLEGILISAHAVGASRCFIFVRENTDFVRRITKALEQMRAYNLLGANILDSHFTSEIEIWEVPASITSGYETELFRCIEEKQPLPHVHPICSTPDEFELKPVVITNPELMSNLSADPAAGIEKSKGSKVITLSGSMAHKYTVEVAFETTIQCIVNELGGGVSNGKAIKAAKLGGPAGVFITPDLFDESLDRAVVGEESNPNFGLGSIEVFDPETCMVDAAKDVMSYIQAQSCGRCSFCREGSLQMLTILEDLTENKGKPQDLELLTDLGKNMKEACLCAFGRAAPNPVLSSIEHFRGEYVERIKESS